LMIMTSGAMLLIFNFFGHESHSPLIETLHPYLAALGGIMIASAHWINMRLCKSCEVCEHDHDGHDHTHGEDGKHGHEHSSAHVHADGTVCSVDHAGAKKGARPDVTIKE